jgi:cobalt/nickel transport system ATP-binding protein
MTTPAIEVNNLSFGYERGINVLDSLSFRIEAGARVAILGSNGAGKSTLVWLLAGLLHGKGDVRIFGETASASHNKVGLVFQNPEDQLFMPSIREDLILPLVNRGMDEKTATAKTQELLQTVGLENHGARPAAKLSYGQRKRAAIAAALILEPEILILDEPTAELDGRGVRELKQTLSSISSTLLVVTHDLAFARDVAERAILLSNTGQVIGDGETAAVLSNITLLTLAGIV